MHVPAGLKGWVDKLTPRQRQWGMLIAIVAGAFGVLWVVFSATDSKPKAAGSAPAGASGKGTRVTNLEVMPGGAQVSPRDQWVGDAGRKLAQYDKEREDQRKLNKEYEQFRADAVRRFVELEEQLRGQGAAGKAAPAPVGPSGAAVVKGPSVGQGAGSGAAGAAQGLPPAPPAPAAPRLAAMPPGTPGLGAIAEPARPGLVRVSLREGTKSAQVPPGTGPSSSGAPKDGGDSRSASLDTYLPVSFTRGLLLGGLDAPTGGQAQSNPHPVLIRLADNAVLPNRFRGDVKECFVIAAGYGDISSERAYLRTENLSCIRSDGSTIEVKIQGSVFGEDGKVGLRGRLVTKQGQMLANALLAGVLGGLGQVFAQSVGSPVLSTSSFGAVATISPDRTELVQRGLGIGVGRALDRLAQYYIKLAEQTFPVIEVDAGREVDVVITKGVAIEGGGGAKPRPTSVRVPGPEERELTAGNVGSYSRSATGVGE